MIDENEKRIAEIIKEKKLRMLSSPSLQQRYEEMLLETFPPIKCTEECFMEDTFTGSDKEDYWRFRNIFEGKSWNEVDLNVLYEKYVQFFLFTIKGKIYYLPTFLRFFYELKHLDLEYFSHFMFDLATGFKKPSAEEMDDYLENGLPHLPKNNTLFEAFDPIQSKLIAIFLVNVANLLPASSSDSRMAQNALTSYWGHFLLF